MGTDLAAKAAGSAHGPWQMANSPTLAIALPNAYFASLGNPLCLCPDNSTSPNRRIRTRTYGDVTGTAGDRSPMSIAVGQIVCGVGLPSMAMRVGIRYDVRIVEIKESLRWFVRKKLRAGATTPPKRTPCGE